MSIESASDTGPIGSFDDLDAIIEELSNTDTKDMGTDELFALVNKMCTAVFQTQKKITSKVSQLAEDARKEHLKKQIGEYRGYTVLAVSAGTGLLHFGGAAANFTTGLPTDKVPFHAKLFENTSTLSQNEVTKLVGIFGSAANASNSVQGIAQSRQQGNITEHSTETEASKLEKQELDQAKSADSNHVDSAKQKEDQRQRGHHEVLQALARG